MSEVHAVRRRRLADAVTALDADAALITRLVNVRYLTGLASSNAALLVLPGAEAVLATDSRYALAARRQCPDLELVEERFVLPALARRLAAAGCRRVLFEAHEVTVEQHGVLTEALTAAGSPAEPVPGGSLVETLRMVKDEAEIAALREACAITGRAFLDTTEVIRPGVTEREIAIHLERRMVDLGAQGPAFDSIVASGPNGALPHHRLGTRPVEAGDLITIDCGASYDGYHADMTRTVAVGEPAGWQREIYDLVARAQAAGLAAVREGADVGEVDRTARDIIAAAGHGEDFKHGLGHGIGLEVHEAPTLGYGRTGTLRAGVPITIEPGIYLAGRGGVRIEDTVVVRAEGPELLTETTKQLLVL